MWGGILGNSKFCKLEKVRHENTDAFTLCTKIEIYRNPKSCNFIKIISQLAKEETEYCFYAAATGQCRFSWKKEMSISFVEISLLLGLEDLNFM